MSRYRRSDTAGGSYFFTVVSYRRQKILCDDIVRTALRDAIEKTHKAHPFNIDAWVLLPDHLHCLWTLPEGDADFSKRWAIIKRHVSLLCGKQYKRPEWLTESKKKHRESTIWQRRYWEHQIRNEDDFNRHVEYIHYNPVKHDLCKQPSQWAYSTFHRYVKEGVYPMNWAQSEVDVGGYGYGE